MKISGPGSKSNYFKQFLKGFTHSVHFKSTVNSEIFARILFSRIAFKNIFATLKIRV